MLRAFAEAALAFDSPDLPRRRRAQRRLPPVADASQRPPAAHVESRASHASTATSRTTPASSTACIATHARDLRAALPAERHRAGGGDDRPVLGRRGAGLLRHRQGPRDADHPAARLLRQRHAVRHLCRHRRAAPTRRAHRQRRLRAPRRPPACAPSRRSSSRRRPPSAASSRALDFHLARSQELAIVAPSGDSSDALLSPIRLLYAPNLLLVGAPEGTGADVTPLLQDRPRGTDNPPPTSASASSARHPHTDPRGANSPSSRAHAVRESDSRNERPQHCLRKSGGGCRAQCLPGSARGVPSQRSSSYFFRAPEQRASDGRTPLRGSSPSPHPPRLAVH